MSQGGNWIGAVRAVMVGAALSVAGVASSGCMTQASVGSYDAGDGGGGNAVVEQWTGYIEQPNNPALADLRIDIERIDNEGAIHGRVVFGNTSPPAPPTDPDKGWPSGWNVQWGAVQPGFEYTIVSGTRSGTRIQLGIAPVELWRDWCPLQAPRELYPGSGAYGCLPRGGYVISNGICHITPAPDGPSEIVDCLKLGLCPVSGGESVCSCSATSCQHAPLAPSIQLDFAIDGSRGNGTITGLAFQESANVRLMR